MTVEAVEAPTERPPTLPRKESTNAAPTFPSPGASLVPRANTTSMFGQSAFATGASPGTRTTAEAIAVTTAATPIQRRTRSEVTVNDNPEHDQTKLATNPAACGMNSEVS